MVKSLSDLFDITLCSLQLNKYWTSNYTYTLYITIYIIYYYIHYISLYTLYIIAYVIYYYISLYTIIIKNSEININVLRNIITLRRQENCIEPEFIWTQNPARVRSRSRPVDKTNPDVDASADCIVYNCVFIKECNVTWLVKWSNSNFSTQSLHQC